MEVNDNNCLFGFADMQNAIRPSFVYDTIPYMKTIKRMTNSCFQETPFATVMKGKHVLNEPDEPNLEWDHIEESSGQVVVGDREEEVTIKRKWKDPPLPMYRSNYGHNYIEGGDIGSHPSSDEFHMNELGFPDTEGE